MADLRRVSLHADGHTVDVTLPGTVPIAELLPSILDLLQNALGSGDPAAPPAGYQLSRPGAAVLDASTTLADNGITNGSLLVVTRSASSPPAPPCDDDAETVSATLTEATRPWTRRHSRLAGASAAAWLAGLSVIPDARHPMCPIIATTVGGVALLAGVLAHRVYREPVAGSTLGLIAVGFAAVAGFTAVPEGPGPANALLAAMSAGAVAVLALRMTGCGAMVFTALSCLGMLIAVSAATTVLVAGPPPMIGALTTVLALVLLEVSARLSIGWAGLSPRPPEADAGSRTGRLRQDAVSAERVLTGLIGAGAAAAAAGAVSVLAGVHAAAPGAVMFAAVTGAVLLVRARSASAFIAKLVLLPAGMLAVSAAFVMADAAPRSAIWMVVGSVAPVAVALCAGFVAPAGTLSPVARRGVELLEYSGLIAVVPLACWACGFYSAARGLSLT